MKRMKTFWIYFLLFIGLILLVNVLTYIGTRNLTKDIDNYEILTDIPQITITECKSGYSKGHIIGNITNNGEKIINKAYIKVDFYNKSGDYIGSSYEEINLLNVGETQRFELDYRRQKVYSLKISLVDERPEIQDMNIELDKNLSVALPISGVLILYYIISLK